MQKTKLGVTVGLLGAAVYFSALFASYIPVIMIAGYILLAEENEWLRKAVIKAVVLLMSIEVFLAIVSLIPDGVKEDEIEEMQSEYILPESDSRILTKEDLDGFDANMCRLARNEIYARHGRMFNDTELQEYFNGCSWYEGSIEGADFEESLLNDFEIVNRDLIVAYEEEMGYR